MTLEDATFCQKPAGESRIGNSVGCGQYNKEWLSDQGSDYKCITQEDYG